MTLETAKQINADCLNFEQHAKGGMAACPDISAYTLDDMLEAGKRVRCDNIEKRTIEKRAAAAKLGKRHSMVPTCSYSTLSAMYLMVHAEPVEDWRLNPAVMEANGVALILLRTSPPLEVPMHADVVLDATYVSAHG